MADASRAPTPGRTHPVALLALALVVGACAWVSIDLTRAAGGVSSIWISNGIIVGLLLFQPASRWPAMLAAGFVGELTARLLHGDALPLSVNNAIANVLEILLIAGAIRRRVPDITDPARLFALAATATGSTLVACAVSALVSCGFATLATGRTFADNLLVWYTAHVISMRQASIAMKCIAQIAPPPIAAPALAIADHRCRAVRACGIEMASCSAVNEPRTDTT